CERETHEHNVRVSPALRRAAPRYELCQTNSPTRERRAGFSARKFPGPPLEVTQFIQLHNDMYIVGNTKEAVHQARNSVHEAAPEDIGIDKSRKRPEGQLRAER